MASATRMRLIARRRRSSMRSTDTPLSAPFGFAIGGRHRYIRALRRVGSAPWRGPLWGHGKALTSVLLKAAIASGVWMLASAAHAQAPAQPGATKSILWNLLPILLLVVIFWLLIFRPQQRR